MKIYCCGCQKEVEAAFVTGQVVYPHRPDLYSRGFWQCPECKNFVGCHDKNKKGNFKPLGCIATPEIKKARMSLHNYIDPLWKTGRIRRQKLYGQISSLLGYEYHTAETKSVEEIEQVKNLVKTHIERLL